MSQNTSSAVMAQRAEPHEWRVVPSFPSYFASASGEIRGPRGKVLKATPNGAGYLQLNVCRDGRIFSRRVHSLVCEAFRGPKPDWATLAAHGDGNMTNNCEWNLRWATHAENSADMISHGTRLIGEAHPRALISQEQVEEIRREYAAHFGKKYVKRGTRVKLAEKHGVGIHVIKDIVGGRSWAS